ncbi:hypothetical protein G6F56_009657 [Rhizopus delemar]|uniref:Tetrapyrrole biosynthesis uroporphyrinogen III synthase domain-containing protein n=1 Tax=Rhizopus stolonifer TaxID=4846 RepID=A0A367IMM6_RHIST|nr:hypothetical protein G6F56_009657 [Rhizopus delemar]RCH78942.1 hypothetical protein CU098_004970 [Rhizopus stolonifer]
MTEKRVWVFKEQKEDNKDKYYDLFVNSNYTPEFIPVLDYKLCNLDILKDILSLGPTYETITGLILTSQKSVHTLNKAYKMTQINDQVRDQWRRLPVYIVGPQTEQLLYECPLFEQAHRDHWIQAPRAAELVNSMVEDLKRRPFKGGPLFLAGDKRRDLIPQTLDKAGIPFRELQSYATCAHPDLTRRLESLEKREAQWAVYFSPSGLKYIQSSFPKSKLLQPSNSLKIAVIGPTTGDYIKELGLPVKVVAEKPDAQHLVNGMVQFDKKVIQ